MPLFDTKTFLQLTGQGNDPVQSVGTAFGMPACLLNMTQEVMRLLPASILGAMRNSTSNGANRADDVIKAALAKMRFLDGIIEYDTDSGTFRFVSDTSKFGNDKNEGGLLADIVGFVGGAAGFAGRLYNNYEATRAQIEGMVDCVGNYAKFLKYTMGGGASAKQDLAAMNQAEYDAMIEAQWAADKQNVANAQDFINRANSLMANIDAEFAARAANPNLEPEFNEDASLFFSGTSFNIGSLPPAIPKEVFRLAFLPPKSKSGQFKLSQDGIYFDSQSQGLVPALLEISRNSRKIQTQHKWKFDYDPNIGGRGVTMSSRDVALYVNTLLDPNIIDESVFMADYYDTDKTLTEITGQKNRRIYDLSSQLNELQTTNAGDALVSNWQQVILSENSLFLQKINKRKKQIELAIKIPAIYNGQVVYEKGHIPVNDFSYLQGLNVIVDIQSQRKLVLDQEEVAGVVLPLQPVYVVSPEHDDSTTLDHILINDVGVGSIISDSSSVSSVAQNNTLSISPVVTIDALFAIYNYLQSNTTNPSSTEFEVFNSIGDDKYNNAQLVSVSPSTVFTYGLGLPYIHGITKNSGNTPNQATSIGSYIRLPDSPEFRNYMFKPTGATFDTWVYLPDITGGYDYIDPSVDATVSGLYRLLLANENTGLKSGVSGQSDELKLITDTGDSVVRGMVMGFTRDRRFTSNATPSNDSTLNPASSHVFFLAPTQSKDASTAGFINRSYYDNANCASGTEWHSFKFPVNTSVSGKSLNAASAGFIHLAVTLDPSKDLISLYCDGQIMTTSSLSYVFGVNPGYMPNLPTFKKQNSFEYNASNVHTSNSNWLAYGPKMDRYFTPWILGAGYTDGNYPNGFMGSQWGGFASGLKGHLGSTKFYSKSLTAAEVLNNYTSQSIFFKNVNIT